MNELTGLNLTGSAVLPAVLMAIVLFAVAGLAFIVGAIAYALKRRNEQ